MLNKPAITLAYPLAQRLAEGGHLLTTTGDSPLSSICQELLANLSISDKDGQLSGQALSEALMVAARMQSSPADYSANGIFDEAVNVISGSVRGTLNRARTVLVPAIKEVVDQVSTTLQNPLDSEITIVQESVPAALTHPALIEMVSKYKDQAPELPPAQPMYRTVITQGDDAYDLVRTGVVDLDDQIVAVLKERQLNPTEYANRIFGPGPTQVVELLQDPVEALIVFALAKHALAVGPMESSTVGLAEFRNYVTTIMANAGRAIANALDRIERRRRRGDVVLRTTRTDDIAGSVVVVDSQTFPAWVKESGGIEVLLGAIVAGQTRPSPSWMAENAEQLRKTYGNWRLLQDEAQVSVRANALRSTLVSACHAQISKILPEPAEGDMEAQIRIKEARDSVRQSVQSLEASALTDLYRVTQQILAKAIYPNGQESDVLTLFDAVSNEYPDLSGREIGLQVLLRYVGNWLAEQLKAVNAGSAWMKQA